MSEQADILDFNEVHRNRNSNQNTQERFSVKRIKQMLTLDVVDKWVEQINMPHTRNYEFPSNLDKAILHQQSCYIQPEAKYLKEQRALNCECCGQFLRRKRYNILTCDMYDIFASEYGTSIPIYFTIMKLQFFILLLLGCIFGIYFCLLSDKYCNALNQDDDKEKEQYDQYCAFMLAAQHFLLYNFRKQQEVHNSTSDQNTYYILGYVAYLIMMLTPMMHEIVLKVQQVKYWKNDSLNHIRIPKLTLYIKHIPKKFNEQEIQLYIQSAFQKQHKYLSAHNFIEEIVYIYDTHPIKELNEQRRETYLKVLQTVDELRRQPTLELKGQLIDLVLQVMKQYRDVQKTLAAGLPFTQKVILKFNSESVTNLVYKFYDKSFFNNLKQQITTIKESAENYQEFKKQKFELQAQLMEQSQTNSSSNRSSLISQPASDLQEVVRTQSEIMKNSPMEGQKKNNNKQSMIKFLHLDAGQEEEVALQCQIDEKKGLHLQRGFRQEDIFWENIGMHTLKRLFLRLITTAITLLAGLMIMALFEMLFLMVQHLKRQQDSGWVITLLIIVMTLFTIALNVSSTILVILMTKKSKRSTYSLQEKNMITFMSPIQQVCILAFPFIFVLSILQRHSALNSVSVILAVSKLAQTRLIAKWLLQTFHLRLLGFNSRKKKIVKQFKPTNFFQKQLNEQLSPPLFPIRSRLFYILFIYSTGLLMTFVNPFILVWCFVLLLIMFYYDKYSVLNQYQCDKLFTFQLQKYLILTYQFIMIPIYCYMYIVTFTNTSTHIGTDDTDQSLPLIKVSPLWTYLGYGTFLLSFLSFAFLRKQLASFFVFTVLRYQRPTRDSTIFNEKSYLQSYNEYYEGLGIQELNTLLTDTFQNMQYKSK